MYNEYVYVKQYVTGGKVSDWTANKILPAQRCVEIVSQNKKTNTPWP
jgi:hypothetical protein